MIDQTTTIAAVATAPGGALSVIRLSGDDSCRIVESVFSGKLKDRTAVFGAIQTPGGEVLDEVLCTSFLAPRSYTGQECVEISCHGSSYLTAEIMRFLVAQGAVVAQAGEFTMRAFLNGKLDLSQAEAVADLIAADTKSAAQVAFSQMKGGYSRELSLLSGQLLDILSLLELELDFGEEDVEFADRSTLSSLISKALHRTQELASSFSLGNVLKNGVAVAIVGKPNVGKSTLLNQLLGHERAIVSPVAGTTRDFIEETLVIEGLAFRFIDTAGMRESEDEIEQIGINRSYEKLREARIVIQLLDQLDNSTEPLSLTTDQNLIKVINKCDLAPTVDSAERLYKSSCDPNKTHINISAKYGTGISELKSRLVKEVNISDYNPSLTVVSNARHHQALTHAEAAFTRTLEAIQNNLPTDLISAEIRTALTHLNEITGEITTNDILGNIFSKFCIGK